MESVESALLLGLGLTLTWVVVCALKLAQLAAQLVVLPH